MSTEPHDGYRAPKEGIDRVTLSRRQEIVGRSSLPAPLGSRRSSGVRRIAALVRKETLQIWRDPSAVGIAIVMPVLLLLLFGYGVSLDTENVRLAIVLEKRSADAMQFVSRFRESKYFRPTLYSSLSDAEEAMLTGDVDAIVHIRHDFEERLRQPTGAPIQVLLNGIDANTARLVSGYIEGVHAKWLEQLAEEEGSDVRSILRPEERFWYNQNVRSRNFLVPGLIAVIMTLIGALLTALIVAREWERGTMETLLVTPVRVGELLISKMIPYYLLGMAGMGLSVLMARWQFDVPLRGSFAWLALGTTLFLLAALGMGLLISTVARIQFVAAQIAIIVTFLPAFILSGFLFDIRSMPPVIRGITYLIPAKYFVSFLHTVFLAGDVSAVLIPNAGALALVAAVLLVITRKKTTKRID